MTQKDFFRICQEEWQKLRKLAIGPYIYVFAGADPLISGIKTEQKLKAT